MELQPPDLHVVPVDPQLPDLLQVGPGAVHHQMVMEPPARVAPFGHINIVERLSPALPSGPEFGEKGADLPHRLVPALGQVLVVIGQGDVQVPVVKVGRQGALQLLKRGAGVQPLPGGGAGLLLLGPGFG